MRSVAVRARFRRLFLRLRRLVAGKFPADSRRLLPVPVDVRRSDLGQTLVEFAFVAPIILIFLLLIVDFGLALDHRQMLQNAVREGARYGAVGHDPAEIIDFTLNESGAPSNTTVTVCYGDEDNDSNAGEAGESVRVSGAYTYKLTVNVLVGAVRDIDMTPIAQARLEKAVTRAPKCP